LGNSGSLPGRTGSDAGSNQGAIRSNNRSGNVGFQSPRNGNETEGDAAATESESGTSKKKKSPGVPKAEDGTDANDGDGTNGARRGPSIISLDEKVAWRAAPVRSRTGVKQQPARARLVRLPDYPKSEWLPVDSDSKIAKN
jgi:hypothetical protein